MNDAVNLAHQVTNSIRSVVGGGPISLHEPSFDGNEWLYVKECLDSTFVSSVGKFVDRLESELAEFTGANYAIAVVNGTAALHIGLKLAGVQAEDEVLVPALTFVATMNAVNYCGAQPHFVDSEPATLGMDAFKLRNYLQMHTEQKSSLCVNRTSGKVIRAMVPMHTFGHPVDVDALLSISRDFNIVIVEDAAESLGSYYGDQHTGTFGSLGAVSFNGNKIITAGGGGAILTNDRLLALRAKHLTTTAKKPHAWEFHHDEVGYNYRLPNINAALGCAQLEQLPNKLMAKNELFRRYQKAFSVLEGVKLMVGPSHGRSNYWLNALVLDSEDVNLRDLLLMHTNEAGLMTRPVWELGHRLEPFKNCPRMDLSMAESLSKRIINIPSSSFLASRA
jgi:perosamine synthetase